MTIQEFSSGFDLYYNNVTSNQAPGLNEWEKSMFLTKAQSQLVSEYFNRRTDGVGGGFDGGEQRQYDFSSLIRVENLFDVNTFKERIDAAEKLDKRSKVYLFPQNYFLAVNEIISDKNYQYSVLPLSYPEYQRLMLKPYNFPVKRGVWRLFTDKKNCNYCVEYVPEPTQEDPGITHYTETDYVIMSGWADQKRNLQVTVSHSNSHITDPGSGATPVTVTNVTYKDGTHPTVYVDDEDIYITFQYKGSAYAANIICNGSWLSSKLTYAVSVDLNLTDSVFTNPALVDDEEVIDILKLGFTYANYYLTTEDLLDNDWETIKVATHIDGFQMCSAPSKFNNFVTGKTFTTEVIQVPMAEIIGKFTGTITYQLRYVRTLKPIILEDLTNYGTGLTINGITQATECELPEETHQEILERAVTLAKIAWQGGTATQAAAQQREDR